MSFPESDGVTFVNRNFQRARNNGYVYDLVEQIPVVSKFTLKLRKEIGASSDRPGAALVKEAEIEVVGILTPQLRDEALKTLKMMLGCHGEGTCG